MWSISPTLNILRIDCHWPFVLCCLGFLSDFEESSAIRDTKTVPGISVEITSKGYG